MKKILILLAGGQGARMFSPVNKVLLNICGKTVIHRSAKAFSGFVDEFIVVCRPEEKDQIMEPDRVETWGVDYGKPNKLPGK